jgi:hypothetical protein
MTAPSGDASPWTLSGLGRGERICAELRREPREALSAGLAFSVPTLSRARPKCSVSRPARFERSYSTRGVRPPGSWSTAS